MSRRINTAKAEANYLKALNQDFIDELEGFEIKQTVKEMFKELEGFGVTKAVLARVLKMEPSTLSKWEKDNNRREYVYWIYRGIRIKHNIFSKTLKLGIDEDED